MSDDQAQAVYAAEDLWTCREPQARIRFGDWHEIWPFYWQVAESCREHGVADVQPPKVRSRKNALKAHYDALLGTVFIPPYSIGGVWSLNVATALHEFAHHLTPGEGHGPVFRQAMVDILKALGWDHELLAQCYAEARLSSSDKEAGITDKVGKLLTHADKAANDEERRTYLEKAERLASVHSINLAMVRKAQADKAGHADNPITGELYSLLALPSITARNLAVELGSAICRAHGAHCTIRGKSAFMTFYGYPEDVHLTELMLTRVTPMMFEEADRYIKSPERKASGVAATSARITFCKNFAWEIGRRLQEAVQQSKREVAEQLALTDGTDSTSMEIAIRDKAVEVADYVAYEFKRQGVRGSWKGSNTNTWNPDAADAGRSAARNANLYGHKEIQ